MTQPLHLTANIFAIEVPEGAAGLDINQYGGGSELNYWLIEEGKQKLIVIDLPPGTWQIIGMAGSVTEGDLMIMHDFTTSAVQRVVYQLCWSQFVLHEQGGFPILTARLQRAGAGEVFVGGEGVEA